MGPYNTVTGNHYIYNHASDIALWRISTGRRHHPLYHIGIGSKSAQWLHRCSTTFIPSWLTRGSCGVLLGPVFWTISGFRGIFHFDLVRGGWA
jgi:hypothetical protein